MRNHRYPWGWWPVWHYLNQPLFVRDHPIVWNPVVYWKLYRIQFLERCWQTDLCADDIQLLERCWLQEFR